MKQRLPGLFCLLTALVVCITAARRDNSVTARFVQQNQPELTALAEEVLIAGFGGNELSYPGVTSIHYTVYMEDGTFHRPCVEFYTYSAIGYAGFYYSPTDIPIPFQGVSDARLTPTASGWTWEFMGNRGSTAKITDCWYTFEAHF